MTPEYLTEEQVLEVFGICRTTLWGLRKKGLPHYRVGSLVRYDINEITNWLRVGSVNAKEEGVDK